MHFLIDGHNLIGKMPDLSLADPQDEVELILRLKGWVAAAPNRRVTIFFDGGGLGGYSHRMSSKDIRVVFAAQGQEADDLLMEAVDKLRNPRSYTVVTSDRRIIDAAVVARIKVLRSEEFIAREGFDYKERAARKKTAVSPETPAASPEKELDPRLSESELKEWLDLFGPVPERKPAPKPKPKPVRKPRRKGQLATPQDRENPTLATEDLDAWLALFGGETAVSPTKPANPSSKNASKKGRSPKQPPPDENPYGLDEDDLQAWRAYFGDD